MIRLLLLSFLAFAMPAQAEEYAVGGYAAFIGPEDLRNSKGVRLESAAAILRQDRANVHRFGIRHADDEIDPWFHQPAARAAMAGMLKNGGGIHPAYEKFIRAGGVFVYVTIYAVDGNFTSLRVEVPG